MPSNSYQRYITDQQRKRKMKRLIWQISIAVVALLVSVIVSMFVDFKSLFDGIIMKNIKLAPGSKGYKSWIDPPITTLRNYYLFNISNGMEIETNPKQTTIKFSDTPAYPYSIVTKKTDVQWSNDNQEVFYAVERSFQRHSTFDPSAVNDRGVFVDMLRAVFRTQYKTNPSDAFYNLDPDGKKNGFFVEANAIDQLEGFTSDLFKVMQPSMYGPNLEKYGFIYRQNGSQLYNVTIKTDTPIKGEILNFTSKLVAFEMTNATYSFPIYDGLTYPSGLNPNRSLNIFNSDFCQPVRIKYKQTVNDIVPGFELYQYELQIVDYSKCTDPSDPLTCEQVDKLDVSKCISTSLPADTIYLSKAHFYGASNETIEQMNVEGYQPSAEKHDSFLYFEPKTGTPFLANFRVQLNINVMLNKMKFVDGEFKKDGQRHVSRLIPVFWIDQNIKLNQKVISMLGLLFKVQTYCKQCLVTLLLGSALITIVIMEVIGRRKDRTLRNMRGGYIRAES